jgi:pyruvate dehydrogenase E2 component (dihydrolipoamide acetyltransferase)
MSEIVMPRLSDTMEEGTILRWLIADGEPVRRGQELVEIETDKATMSYESDQDGVLQIVAPEGDTLAVGELIARVGAPGEDGSSGAAAGAELPPPSVAGREADTMTSVAAPKSGPPVDAPIETSTGSSAATAPGSEGARVKASPLAKRIADERGVDLHTLTGSGPGGRIVKADVQAADIGASAPSPPSSPAPTPPTPPAPTPQDVATAKGETTTVELSRTQQTIARRMAESKATIPDFTLQAEVDMEACVALRTELKRLSQPEASTQPAAPTHPEVPTYNDMVVKACALALREHPRANGGSRDGRLQLHSRINIGVAVAARDALVVPTVFDAEEKSLGEIARETRALAERVRDGTITPPELGGGTFTVSNLGMYGVKSFTAIVNPPQAAILSVGSVAPRAVVHEGEVVARHTMTITLACDHRILYGADAAQLLARVRELLEQPAALTL